MNTRSILNKCENFYKIATMFEPPSNMVENIMKKAKYIYASAVLHHINTIPVTPQIDQLKNEIKKYTNKPLSSRQDFNILIDLDLENWKHLTNPKIKELVDSWNKSGQLNEEVEIVFSFDKLEDDSTGLYYPGQGKMSIYMNDPNIESIEEFNNNMNIINDTLHHELQHYAQEILSNLIKIHYNINKQLAGLPPKKYRSKTHDSSGFLKKTPNEGERSSHELRDIEFYTNLNDSVADFKRVIPNIYFKRDFAKAWVNLPNNFLDKQIVLIKETNQPDKLQEHNINKATKLSEPHPLFQLLKNKNEKKWKLAVKIFWKKIDYLLGKI